MHIAPWWAARKRGPAALLAGMILALGTLVSGCGLYDVASAAVMPSELTRIAPNELTSLKTIGEYQVQDRQLIFVTENGAVPNVPIPLLIDEAKVFATFNGQTMSANVDSLGTGNPLEATTSPRQQKRQYIVFTSNKTVFENVVRHEAGNLQASGWGYTIDSDDQALVTLLRVPTVGEAVPPNTAPAETEMCQLTLKLTATPASFDRFSAQLVAVSAKYPAATIQAKLDLDAQEEYCNSMGRATNRARAGSSYDEYQAEAADTKLGIDGTAVQELVFDQSTYSILGRAT